MTLVSLSNANDAPSAHQVFRRYYLAKIQGELLEASIRRAWEDLHHGTGRKSVLRRSLFLLLRFGEIIANTSGKRENWNGGDLTQKKLVD